MRNKKFFAVNALSKKNKWLAESGIIFAPSTVDLVELVEVVRCKDCIGKAHWYTNDYGCTICGLSGLFVVEDRDFCSYGERKDNERKAD